MDDLNDLALPTGLSRNTIEKEVTRSIDPVN
jgi:hypothetical protein